MIKIAFVSQTLTPMGGGGKDIAITFLHLNRQIFDPYVFSLCDPAAWREEYGIPADRCRGVDIWNLSAITEALRGFDVVYLMVGTTNEPSEYETIWSACATVGVKVRVMRIVFGLGKPKPEMAELFLTSSMDSHLVGTPCRGCHVIYPPLPPHKSSEGRAQFRARYGIGIFEKVVGYSCADHRPEFFDVARKLGKEGSGVVFLSALARPENFDVPPNVRFCGTLRQREMPSFYEASDLILHTRTESFGYSPYQAMAAGVPVVALWTASRNAFAETMYPGGGWLAKTVDGLAEALYAANLEEALFGRARPEIARRKLHRMSPENSVRRFEFLVLEALRGKGYFTDVQPTVPNYYVTDNDIEMWRASKAEIERRLETELYV
jgi:glycosyltransferase involved in cell wall biosynthesis